MKSIILAAFVLTMTGCAKKEWSKEYMSKKCNKEFKQKKEITDRFNDAQLTQLCDCVGEKMFKNYKSEAAANQDLSGAQDIGRDCAMEVLQK